MGCGTWGGNSFSDNMNYRHYMNITRIVAADPPNACRREDEMFGDYFAQATARDAEHVATLPTVHALIERAGRAPAAGAVYAIADRRDRRATHLRRPARAAAARVAALLRQHGRRSQATRSRWSCPTASRRCALLLGAMYGGYCVEPGQPAVAARADALRARALRLRARAASRPSGRSACARCWHGIERAGRGASWSIPMRAALPGEAEAHAAGRRGRPRPTPSRC